MLAASTARWLQRETRGSQNKPHPTREKSEATVSIVTATLLERGTTGLHTARASAHAIGPGDAVARSKCCLG